MSLYVSLSDMSGAESLSSKLGVPALLHWIAISSSEQRIEEICSVRHQTPFYKMYHGPLSLMCFWV